MSNHIDHIEITNFKSIRHQKIDGCKRINVFIGYPNVGKSAILEALSSLSYLEEEFSVPFSELCRIQYAHEIFYNAYIKSEAIVDIGKASTHFNYLSESDFALTSNIPKSNSNEFKPFRRLQYSGGGKGFSNDFQFSSKPVATSFSFTTEEIERIKILPVVKKYVFKNNFNDDKTNALNLFSPYGENLVDIVQFNKEVRKEVGELFKFYGLKLLIDQATNSIRGLKQLDEETIFTIPFYQMADTLQRLIFHKAAIMSNENTVLLFEEPEAHMFPPYISKFTGDIIYNKDNGNQYFISTHSPFVMNDFLEDAREELSVYVVGLKDGETIIKRLTDEQLHEVYQFGVDLFFNIEDYIK